MDERDALVRRIGEVLADRPIAFGFLFGSWARGDARPDSDVDVAVRFEPGRSRVQRFDELLRLGGELETALQREVDVVDLDEASLRLAGRILSERVVVAGHERVERVRYETDLFPRWVDFEHHARQLDDELLAATAEGER
jgi:predicted nucleotidyltransferase